MDVDGYKQVSTWDTDEVIAWIRGTVLKLILNHSIDYEDSSLARYIQRPFMYSDCTV